MNERIRELAIQAAKKHGHTIRFTEEITETLNSFAELIIRDCDQYARSTWEHGELLGGDLKRLFDIDQ